MAAADAARANRRSHFSLQEQITAYEDDLQQLQTRETALDEKHAELIKDLKQVTDDLSEVHRHREQTQRLLDEAREAADSHFDVDEEDGVEPTTAPGATGASSFAAPWPGWQGPPPQQAPVTDGATALTALLALQQQMSAVMSHLAVANAAPPGALPGACSPIPPMPGQVPLINATPPTRAEQSEAHAIATAQLTAQQTQRAEAERAQRAAHAQAQLQAQAQAQAQAHAQAMAMAQAAAHAEQLRRTAGPAPQAPPAAPVSAGGQGAPPPAVAPTAVPQQQYPPPLPQTQQLAAAPMFAADAFANTASLPATAAGLTSPAPAPVAPAITEGMTGAPLTPPPAASPSTVTPTTADAPRPVSRKKATKAAVAAAATAALSAARTAGKKEPRAGAAGAVGNAAPLDDSADFNDSSEGEADVTGVTAPAGPPAGAAPFLAPSIALPPTSATSAQTLFQAWGHRTTGQPGEPPLGGT